MHIIYLKVLLIHRRSPVPKYSIIILPLIQALVGQRLSVVPHIVLFQSFTVEEKSIPAIGCLIVEFIIPTPIVAHDYTSITLMSMRSTSFLHTSQSIVYNMLQALF